MKIKPFDKRKLVDVIHKLAKIYAKKEGIKVVPGPNFETNGKVIRLVPLRPDAGDDEVLFYELGFLHELGHVIFTDFGMLKSWFEEMKSRGDLSKKISLFGTVQNVLEDVREERLMNQRYYGTTRIMHQAMAWINVQRDYSKMPLFKTLTDLMYLRPRYRNYIKEGLDGPTFRNVPDKAEKIYEKVFAEFEEEVAWCDDQERIMVIAEIVTDRILEEAAKEPDEPEEDEPDEPCDNSDEPPPPPQPLQVGDVIRLKDKKVYGVVTGRQDRRVMYDEITKEEAKKRLKGG